MVAKFVLTSSNIRHWPFVGMKLFDLVSPLLVSESLCLHNAFFLSACLQGGNAFAVNIGRLFDPELRRLVSCLPSRAVEAKASSTTERYSRAFQKFREWASCHREIIPLPSDEVSVAIYLEFLLQSNCSFSALESACCGINWAHNLYGFPTPCNSSLVRNILEARKRKLENLFPKKSLLFLL